MRFFIFFAAATLFISSLEMTAVSSYFYISAGFFGIMVLYGVFDLVQRRHSLWRNYPIVGRARWMLEFVRPYLRQYLVESDTDGMPYDREQRSLVYRRAKNVVSVEPFGSHLHFDENRYEWLNHSVAAKSAAHRDLRVHVGGAACTKPYQASVFNISAMSFGALGAHAIEALNRGAAAGGFYHDTGEGAISPYHLHGGDLVWEIGTGYFGCRARDGGFDGGKFAQNAARDCVKMIEIKLSQGAKPGHGGVLPGAKVTAEIARTRGIAQGVTCVSPPFHSTFSTPTGLLEFVASLRELSGGKPVGFKLCIGHHWEFLAIVKAMLKTRILPDFIVIDGAEGGTGAAPVEFQDHIGTPLRDGLIFARNALAGAGLKDDIRMAASAKMTSAFGLASTMAMGADWCNAARGFMFALGCVQSLNCNTNRCPTGITTQDKLLQRGLVVADKARRVSQYHRNTIHALCEVVAAAGCTHSSELRPCHIYHRISATEARPANEVYEFLPKGILLDDPGSTCLAASWASASADTFASQ